VSALIEQQVLGSALMGERALEDVLARCRPIDFTSLRHQVFIAIERLRSDGEPVDLVSVTSRVGTEHAAEIASWTSTATAGRIGAKIDELKRESLRRRTYNLAATLREFIEEKADPAAVLDFLDRQITELRSEKALHYQNGASFSEEIRQELEAIAAGKALPVTTGFRGLDFFLDGGLRGGEMIILGARTSVGKTAFLISMLRAMVRAGFPVGFLSLEMAVRAIGLRLASISTGVPLSDLRSGTLDANGSDLVGRFLNTLKSAGFLIANPRGATIADVRALARMMVRRDGARIVAVDYMSLIRAGSDRRPRHEIVADWSGQLKTAAEELDVPIIVLVQINRQGEGQEPTLANLRESGAIEQDADVVLFLHRDRTEDHGELIVAKNRSGRLGRVNVEFDGPRAAYSESYLTKATRRAMQEASA
jgi:replicative DNA helicase